MPKYVTLNAETYTAISPDQLIGATVCRGADWKWGHQDFGGAPSMQGKVVRASDSGYSGNVVVRWNSGKVARYRWNMKSADGVSIFDLAIISMPGTEVAPVEVAPVEVAPVAVAPSASAVMKILADALAEKFADAPAISEAVIASMVADEVRQQLKRVKPVAIKVGDNDSKIVEGLVHESFATLLRAVSCDLPVMMVGPAGSGKTSAAAQVAQHLGLEFTTQSVCSQTTASLLLGYMDANGRYIPSLFRQRYEFGGVYLIDEIDAGNPNVLAVLNAALSNGHCAFPDGMVKRHEDFRCIAAANTWGTGRTIEYVGRQALDAATLDRFVQVSWGYDEAMERTIAGNDEWVTYVQAVRKAVAAKSLKHLVTPRSSIYGAKLLAAGMSRAEVEQLTIFKGLDSETAKGLSLAARG